MTRLRIGASALVAPARRARAAVGAVAHTVPPSSATPAAPDRRRNALRVNPSDPSIGGRHHGAPTAGTRGYERVGGLGARARLTPARPSVDAPRAARQL